MQMVAPSAASSSAGSGNELLWQLVVWCTWPVLHSAPVATGNLVPAGTFRASRVTTILLFTPAK